MSVSTFFAIAFPALLLLVGLAVDGGAYSVAQREAQITAAESARVGADAAAAYRLIGQDGSAVALAAARDSAARHTAVNTTVRVNESGRLTVRTTTSASTTFLSLIGVTQLNAVGEASANLYEG